MKYCTSYYQSEPARQKVDELRFSPQVLNDALNYAERHSDKRVIVEILSLRAQHMPSLDKLHKIHAEQPNIFYDFYDLSDLVEYAKYFQRQVNYIMYHQPVNNWGLIQILLYYHVSDILIDEPLLFNMNDINTFVRSQGVNIRVRPHIAKSAIARNIEADAGIHHFWVLPQHVSLYEQYIDVLDLCDVNLARETALINTYTNKAPFTARLDTLIEGVECEISAAFIDEQFVTRRLNCQQNCLKSLNHCHFCDQYVKMYDVITAQRKSSN